MGNTILAKGKEQKFSSRNRKYWRGNFLPLGPGYSKYMGGDPPTAPVHGLYQMVTEMYIWQPDFVLRDRLGTQQIIAGIAERDCEHYYRKGGQLYACPF